MAKNYITALTEVVIANNNSTPGSESFQQPNNCNNEISNLISINNSVVLSASQDVNNNDRETSHNNASPNEDASNDLGDLEPSLFENATDPFEII